MDVSAWFATSQKFRSDANLFLEVPAVQKNAKPQNPVLPPLPSVNQLRAASAPRGTGRGGPRALGRLWESFPNVEHILCPLLFCFSCSDALPCRGPRSDGLPWSSGPGGCSLSARRWGCSRQRQGSPGGHYLASPGPPSPPPAYDKCPNSQDFCPGPVPRPGEAPTEVKQAPEPGSPGPEPPAEASTAAQRRVGASPPPARASARGQGSRDNAWCSQKSKEASQPTGRELGPGGEQGTERARSGLPQLSKEQLLR